MHYRRAKQRGGSYFFTVNLADRKSDLLIKHIEGLREVLKKATLWHPFHIDAVVVLPDHLHTIWTLPKEDADYPKRWMLIKKRIFQIHPQARMSSQEPNQQRRERHMAMPILGLSHGWL